MDKMKEVNGSCGKMREIIPLKEDNCLPDVQESHCSHEVRSTYTKIAVVAPLCLIDIVMFGAFSVLAPFFPKEVRHVGYLQHIPLWIDIYYFSFVSGVELTMFK